MRHSILDLRTDGEFITLDHCYLLLERLGQSLDCMEGTESVFKEIAEEIDPTSVQEYLQRYFEAPEFYRLYRTEMGKGILVGVIVKSLLDKSDLSAE